jgi:hypothetical protein
MSISSDEFRLLVGLYLEKDVALNLEELESSRAVCSSELLGEVYGVLSLKRLWLKGIVR